MPNTLLRVFGFRQAKAKYMSMEIYVLSDKQLDSIASWQHAIEGEGFQLRLDNQRGMSALRGHLPAWWGEKHAGFECDHWSVEDLAEEPFLANTGRKWRYALAFRWGADLYACQGAYMAATAYARATDGVVFDPDSQKLLSPEQALQTVRKMEEDLPRIEAAIAKMALDISAKK